MTPEQVKYLPGEVPGEVIAVTKPTVAAKPAFRLWQHDDLLNADFPEQKWIVHDLVPEASLILLGGRKKLGKSWLALQMAQAVASGALFLQRPTCQGGALYFCLEDGERRLNRRLLKQNAVKGLPIHYVTGRFQPLDEGGLSDLRAAIVAHQPVLVIVDTLAAAKTGRTDENAAGDMADLANALRDLAQEHNTSIVVVAHHGKASFGDPGHDLRGSSAVAAAADVSIGLYKTESGHVLKAEGRDLEDSELRIQFDAAYTWCWQLVGDARQIAREEAEDEVLQALEALGEADANSIAKELDKHRSNVLRALKRLVLEGQVSARGEKQGRSTRMLYRRENTLTVCGENTGTPHTPHTPHIVESEADGVHDVRGVRHICGDPAHRETCSICGTDVGPFFKVDGAYQCKRCNDAWLDGDVDAESWGGLLETK